MREIFKPSVLNVGFSLGFFLVLFFIYPATLPSEGPSCTIGGGESLWIFYSYYCVTAAGALMGKTLVAVIWSGIFAVAYVAMSLILTLGIDSEVERQEKVL